MGFGYPGPRQRDMLHRQTDRQLQQEGELPFQLQGAYVCPPLGPSGSPLSKLCPGRGNKAPGLLRHGHSSRLGRPLPSKATPEINGKRFIRGLGGEPPTPPPPAAPLLVGLCFLSEQAAPALPDSRSGRGGPLSGPGGQGERDTADPPVHSLIPRLTNSFRQRVLVSFVEQIPQICPASFTTCQRNRYKADRSHC